MTLGANTLIGGAGNDVFQFSAGSANGATVADFTHDQVSEFDLLVFSGFGTAAEGATFSQIGATDQWQIDSGLDAHNETITLGVLGRAACGGFRVRVRRARPDALTRARNCVCGHLSMARTAARA